MNPLYQFGEKIESIHESIQILFSFYMNETQFMCLKALGA